MNPPSRLALCLLAFAALLVSCGKPKEVAYAMLGYEKDQLIDPDTKKPFTGIAKDYHPNGQLKAEWPCKDGRPHGTVKEWYPNGKPMAETDFVNGERTGRNIEYTEAGLPWQERTYDRDRIVSERKLNGGK